MNISVYFYDEEGKYTHMDMAPLEYDDEGVQILPENSTDIYPPDLSTDPRFSVERNEWIPQMANEPISSEELRSQLESLRREVEDLRSQGSIETVSRRVSRVEEDYNRTKYYLGIVLPSAKHYFQ